MLIQSLCLLKCRPIIPVNSFKQYSTLNEINKKMAKVLDISSNGLGAKTTLKQILKLAQDLRASGESFNNETFEHILSAYAKAEDHQKTLLLHKQMLANGIKPEKTFYYKALRCLGKAGDAVSQATLLQQMEYFGYPKTSKIYACLFLCMNKSLELERALDTLDSMGSIKPSLLSYLQVIDIAIRLREPTAAFELLKKAEKLDAFNTQSNGTIYTNLLRIAAYNGNYKIVLDTWNKAVNECKMKLDEGLLLYVLDVAGKHSDPKLAAQVIQNIGENGYVYREAHFIPLIEAFASTGDMKNTFQVFSAMRNVGVIPSKRTALPVAHKLGKDKNAIRQARESLESAAATDGQEVDVSAFNLVIHALAYNNEYDEALELYHSAKELGVVPDSETLDATLDACIHCKDARLGKFIFDDLIDKGVKQTNTTLSKMVTLMCTQENYEDAFLYLEKMKQLKMIPLRGCYYKLVKTLSKSGDPRLKMALDDMEAYGYPLSTHMTEFMERDKMMREREETQNPISIM